MQSLKSIIRQTHRTACMCVVIAALPCAANAADEGASSGRSSTRVGIRANAAANLPRVDSETTPAIASDESRDAIEHTEATSPEITRGRASSRSVGSGVGAASPGGWSDMLWPLGVVLALVGGVAWAARRWMPRSLGMSGGQSLRIVARQALSTRQSICLVKFGRRLVLVGVTPERISPLSEISDASEAAELTALIESGRPGSFASLFSGVSEANAQEVQSVESELQPQSEFDTPLPSGRDVAHASAEVRGLLDRVRKLSSEFSRSAESTGPIVASK